MAHDFAALMAQMGQSQSQPKGLVEPGNVDLNARPRAMNPDGRVSTVLSAGFNFGDGVETVIPTISPDGKFLSNDEAVALYRRTGQHLGKFDNVENASRYGMSLHNAQDKQYGDKRRR